MSLGGRDMVLGGALLAGVVVGLTASVSRLYIAEVSSPCNRAVLCNLPGLATALSLLVNFSLGDVMPWRFSTLVCGCAPCVVHILGTIMLPNSPRWLVHRGASDDVVRKAITFFRGKQANVDVEIKDIQQSLKGRPSLNILRQVQLVFTDWEVGKPCLLVMVQFCFETFCGGIVLTQYALTVFQLAVTSLAPAQCSQLLAALQVVALACSVCLMRWYGRRTILIWAALLTGLGQLIVAAYFQFEGTLGAHTWLVVLGLVLANAGSQGGISPLSHLFCGELLPLAVRQLFGNVASLHKGALSMAFVHLFPVLRAALGTAGLFAALAAVNVLQLVFAAGLLPETRDLTLEQIQVRHFSSRRRAAAAETAGGAERPADGVEAESGGERQGDAEEKGAVLEENGRERHGEARERAVAEEPRNVLNG